MLNRSGNPSIRHVGGTDEKLLLILSNQKKPLKVHYHALCNRGYWLVYFCATCMSVHEYNQSVSLVDPLLILTRLIGQACLGIRLGVVHSWEKGPFC